MASPATLRRVAFRFVDLTGRPGGTGAPGPAPDAGAGANEPGAWAAQLASTLAMLRATMTRNPRLIIAILLGYVLVMTASHALLTLSIGWIRHIPPQILRDVVHTHRHPTGTRGVGWRQRDGHLPLEGDRLLGRERHHPLAFRPGELKHHGDAIHGRLIHVAHPHEQRRRGGKVIRGYQIAG